MIKVFSKSGTILNTVNTFLQSHNYFLNVIGLSFVFGHLTLKKHKDISLKPNYFIKF